MNLLGGDGLMVKTTILAVLLFQVPLRVNVLDHGAKPDENTDSTAAIERAYRVLKNQVDQSREGEGILYIPSAPKSYLVTRPIVIEDPGIRIQGDGDGSRLLNVGSGPIFSIGLRTKENTGRRVASLDPRYFPTQSPPAFGGNGIRLNGDSSIVFYGTPFDLGAPTDQGGFSRYQGQKSLTIELLFENHETTWRQFGIFSLGGYHSRVVFRLGTSGNANQLDFQYTDSTETLRGVSFKIHPGRNLIRMRLDLEKGKFDSWVDGVLTESDVPKSDGLAKNHFEPFLIGCDNNTSDGRVPMQSPGRRMPDISIYGLRLSDRLVQEDPLSVGLDAKCIAQLFGRDNSSSRLVSAFSGANQYRVFYGQFVQVDQSALLGGLRKTTISDLQLVNGTPASPVIQALACLDLNFKRLRVSGGSQGISIVPGVATYYVSIDDCRIQAKDYCIAASWALIRANNIDFTHVGRGAILTQACDVRLRRASVAFASPFTDTIVSTYGGMYGGRHRYEMIDIDMEGDSCRVTPFYMEKSNNLRSSLRLDDIYLGSSSKDRPLVISKGRPGQDNYFIEIGDIDDTAGKPSTQIQERLP